MVRNSGRIDTIGNRPLILSRPDGISSIIAFLRSSTKPGSNPLQLPRILTILLQIIKELSTARLQRTRVNLQAISPEIFHLLGSIYVDKVNRWASFLEQGGADGTALLEPLEQSLTSVKVIRRLIIAGFEHPNRDKEVQDFWLLTYSHFSRFLSFVHGQTTLPEQVLRSIEKHLLQLSKLHVEMARTHPASFSLLPDSISLVQSYWTLVIKLGGEYDKLGTDSESEGKSMIEQTGLRALLLIRACAKMAFNPMHTFKYQTPRDKEERKQAVDLIKTQLFTNDFVVNVMELLVTQFFRFRKGDFEEWEEAPEEWERREAEITEAWEFSIRSCSEKLFLDLVIHFKELLIPRLLTVFYSFAGKQKSSREFRELNPRLTVLCRPRETRCSVERLALFSHWPSCSQSGAALRFQCLSGVDTCAGSADSGTGIQCSQAKDCHPPRTMGPGKGRRAKHGCRLPDLPILAQQAGSAE